MNAPFTSPMRGGDLPFMTPEQREQYADWCDRFAASIRSPRFAEHMRKVAEIARGRRSSITTYGAMA